MCFNNQRLNIKARIYLIMEWLIHVLECISLLYYKDSDVKYLHAFIDWLECGDCITSISQIIKSCLGVFHPSVLVHLHSFSWVFPTNLQSFTLCLEQWKKLLTCQNWIYLLYIFLLAVSLWGLFRLSSWILIKTLKQLIFHLFSLAYWWRL